MSSTFKYFRDLFDICYYYSDPTRELSDDSKRLYEMSNFDELHNALVLSRDIGYGSLLAKKYDYKIAKCNNIKLLKSDGSICFTELNFTEDFIFLSILDEHENIEQELNISNLDDYFNALLLIHSEISLPAFDELTELRKIFASVSIENCYWSIVYAEGEEKNYGY